MFPAILIILGTAIAIGSVWVAGRPIPQTDPYFA